MATAAYNAWTSAGRPNSGLIRPMARLRDLLRRYGYTVYDMGNADHLTHNPPEDHTPFSATGWPGTSPRWWLHAIDIMPPRAGSGLPSLQQLGAQMLADRVAGHPGMAWLKFQNWEPDRDNGGRCFKDAFRPGHERTASTDRGHIHQSGRTDMAGYTGADDYDPVARVRAGGTPASTTGDDMTPEQDRMLANIYYTLTTTDGGLGAEHMRWIAAFERLAALQAAAVADKARDEANTAALTALAAAIKSGGGSVDVAAITAAVNTAVDKVRVDVTALAEKLVEAEAREAKLRVELAAAYAGKTAA